MQSEVVQSIRNELKSSISQAKQIGQPYLVFLPERSPAWSAVRLAGMRDISYPYNDYITFDSIRWPLIKQLQADYPDSAISNEQSRIVISFS